MKLKKNIILKSYPKEDSLAFLEKAKELSPDPKDAVYFAVALKMGANIWSNDKRLKSQNTIKIVSTNELIEGLSSMDV